MGVCTSSLLVFCKLWEGSNRKRPILYICFVLFLYRIGGSRCWMVSTLVALGFNLCFMQCFCWLHRVVGSCLHWSSALFANVKRQEWKYIQGKDHDSQIEKVDIPSPGPGQVSTPDGVVQVSWGLFHEYGVSGAWDWWMDWGSIRNDVETVHSFQSISFKLLDAARHQLWKTTYCCCHLLQHLKGSQNVHSTDKIR